MLFAVQAWGRDITWRQSDAFGEHGRGRSEIRRPVDVAVLSHGTLIALDSDEESLVLFSDRGRYERTLGGSGGATIPELDDPAAVAVDEDDRIWVVDRGNHRIVVLDSEGGQIFTVGSLGSSEGRFRAPSGITFDGKGRAYVADTENGRIQVLRTRDGRVLAEWDGRTGGRRGHLEAPVAVAYSGYGRGGLWVLNEGGSHLELFDLDGEWQRRLTLPPEVEGAVTLRDVVVESTLFRMFLTDSTGHRVIVLDRRGRWMTAVQADEDLDPRGIAVTRQLDLYVADAARGRIVSFETR